MVSINRSNAVWKIPMCMKCFCDQFPFFFTIRSLKLKRTLYFQATHETNFPDEKEDHLFIDSPGNNGVPDNQGDSYSASTKRPLPKKFKKSKEDETMDEALQVLRKSNNQKQEDSFDIFGKHSANEIRSLDNANAQRWVKLLFFKSN